MASASEMSEASAVERFTLFRKQLQSIYRKYEIDWATERDSDPSSTEGGKRILDRLAEKLTKLPADFDLPSHQWVLQDIVALVRDAKKVQRHILTLGGVSYEEFWKAGDQVIERLQHLVAVLKQQS